MKITVEAAYPRKYLVLYPENHAEQFQLKDVISECDRLGFKTVKMTDIDGDYTGHGIVLPQSIKP